MKICCFIQCRSDSARLPGKCFKKIDGIEIIRRCFLRCRYVFKKTYVIIPVGDTELSTFLTKSNIPFFEGDKNDVLNRYDCAAQYYGADYVVRVTGDCPAPSAEYLLYAKKLIKKYGFDFISNCFYPRVIVDGHDVECLSYDLLHELNMREDVNREHVTKTLYENSLMTFSRYDMADRSVDLSMHKTSIDTEEDYLRVKEMMERGQR